MILVLDNYDSFTYNLVQYAWESCSDLKVCRNDQVAQEEIGRMRPEKIIVSPGPGRPENAGISVEVVKEYANVIPILGVCLGHQAVAAAFGGQIVRAPDIVHGKTSVVTHDDSVIFKNVPEFFEAARYHSLMVERKTLPGSLRVTAETDGGVIMALEHKEYPAYGVQFHPESIATGDGRRIIENFLSYSSSRDGD